MNENEKLIKEKISLTCVFLCLYFLLLPLDFIPIGGFGSITKLLAILPVLFVILRGRTILSVKKEPILKWLILLLLFAIISYFTSVMPSMSKEAIVTLTLNILMVIIVGACQVYNEREIKYLMMSLVFSGWLTAVMLLVFGVSSFGRMTILIGDAQQDQNYLCGFMIFAFIFHFSTFLKERKIIQLVLSFLIILAVILTGSRGALVAFFACVVFCTILAEKNNGNRVRTIVIAIIAIIIVYIVVRFIIMPYLDGLIINRFTIDYLINNGTIGRTKIWGYLLNKYRNSSLIRQIFGYGYGTTKYINDMIGSMGKKVAHNLYIDNLISLGIVGFIVTLGLHISCIKTGVLKNAQYYLCCLIGFIVMCLSMSLTSYKPLWATIIMLLIMPKQAKGGFVIDGKS